ncbi:MAG: XRE family transcriptional regulator [Ilumatobacter sp.]|nr:MAG: XRE family transcriptional regulator [Ilumatobacter sp.]
MDASTMIRAARERSGLTLRSLAERAGTSHSTLAAYESGRTVPTVATLQRVLRAAGFDVDVTLSSRAGGSPADRHARGLELIEVLELAEMFPARHEPGNTFPRFDQVA